MYKKMNKYRLIVLPFLCIVFAFVLIACNKVDVEPLENPDLDAYEMIYEGEFDIYRLIELYDGPVLTFSFSYGIGDDTVMVGHAEQLNYMVGYEGKYYDFLDFNEFQLISVDLLDELNIID